MMVNISTPVSYYPDDGRLATHRGMDCFGPLPLMAINANMQHLSMAK
jgi:hypothetical protein